jgi:hypothetical protein
MVLCGAGPLRRRDQKLLQEDLWSWVVGCCLWLILGIYCLAERKGNKRTNKANTMRGLPQRKTPSQPVPPPPPPLLWRLSVSFSLPGGAAGSRRAPACRRAPGPTTACASCVCVVGGCGCGVRSLLEDGPRGIKEPLVCSWRCRSIVNRPSTHTLTLGCPPHLPVTSHSTIHHTPKHPTHRSRART